MQQKSLAPVFGVILLLLLVPFGFSYLEKQLSRPDTLISVPTASAATTGISQIKDFTAAGYIGEDEAHLTSLNPLVLGVSTSRASPIYQAREVARNTNLLNLKPGQGITVWVDFLNTGNTTWKNYGPNYVSLKVTNPTTRKSSFRHRFWKSPYQPARLLQKEVKPGKIGRFRFALQAPTTNGLNVEDFNLVIGNKTKLDGGFTRWLIGVGEKYPRPADYQAEEINRSVMGTIKMEPGKAMTFWVDFKNTGLKTWYNTGDNLLALNVTDPIGRVSLFKHDFWNQYYYQPTKLLQSRVFPGETGRFRFAIQAPSVPGLYTENFGLITGGKAWATGGNLILNIQVGDISTTTTNAGEPNVRIGLYDTTNSVQATANGQYVVTDMNSNSSTTKASGEITAVQYSANTYQRLVPTSPDSIMTISSFENRPSWNKTLNDNTFRGAIEIRYSTSTNKMWVINELPVESYLKGLAEVTNGQPQEYLKTLITAARSYVLWHELRGGKHPTEFYDINATTDQVYRGYGFEMRSIDPLLAVQATAGMAITHPDAITQLNPHGVALAPYSSGTDGRTRSWLEVWDTGGYPWITSVSDPYGIISNWATLPGNHMVGLSAQGARGYAVNENKAYDWILKHYYTGVNVEKIY